MPTDQNTGQSTALTFKTALRTLSSWIVISTVASPWLLAQEIESETRSANETSRPNIVWVISEDNSKHSLKHFDPSGASTPAIESMAAHGITFDRAFSNAPVCSVARTTLLTGCYAPRIGTHLHRPHRRMSLPEGLKPLPAYLKDAGYYTTNQSKEDYNINGGKTAWNESSKKASWKNRPSEDTPFFHVQTFGQSHESSLHFDQSEMKQNTKHAPKSLLLPPYYPDTPTFRYTRARYHDNIQTIDEKISRVLADLEEAGQLERTFVFYFGDHGGVLPGSKGYLFETGLHVPLVVRVPDQFKEQTGRELNSRTRGFVEFVDFGPTILELASVDIPPGIDGQPFLGSSVDPAYADERDEAFGYADRFDEKYDMVRSLRLGKWKYIRHFEAFYPNAMQNNYRYNMLAYQEWRSLYKSGELDSVQAAFFNAKPVEALYNLEKDPHETNNLAGDPEHQTRLQQARERLSQRLSNMPDLGFIPEAYLIDEAAADPAEFGKSHQAEIDEYLRVANLSILPFAEAATGIRAAIGSEDPLVRYWAVIAATCFGDEAGSLAKEMEKRLVDMDPIVTARAVEFFAHSKQSVSAKSADPRPYLYRSLQRAVTDPEALQILNTAVFLNDHCGDEFKVDAKKIQLIIPVKKKSEVERRMNYLSGEL